MTNKRQAKRDTVRFRVWLRRIIYDNGSNLTRFGETYGNEYGFNVRDVMRWANGSNLPSSTRIYSLSGAISELVQQDVDQIIIMMVSMLHVELRKS
jgi:hypothetical protein